MSSVGVRLTTEGEVMLFGGLWPPGGAWILKLRELSRRFGREQLYDEVTDQLRHLWGTARGGPPSRVAQACEARLLGQVRSLHNRL